MKKILWRSTTASQKWKDNGALKASDVKNGENYVSVNPAVRYQVMDENPWGGCFNERGWRAAEKLSDKERETIIDMLFGDEGLRLTAARTPVAASDFAVEPYSYNETENDYEMSRFSIKRDYKYLIPYIKAAQKARSNLKIFATPWTPPSWMKKNHSLTGGEIDFTSENMKAYALYMAKYISEYKNEGIDLYAITPQNEPTMDTAYPSCLWTGEQINIFIRDYLYPTLKKQGITADIWLGTFTDSQPELVMPSLGDEKTLKIIKAAAFQWWGAPLASEIGKKYTELKLVQSETKCGDGKNDWKYAEEQFDCFKEFLEAGVSQYFLWNMILDEKGANTAKEPWFQNAPVTVNSLTNEISYNPSYYLTKHFSYYIEAGAARIKTSGNYKDVVAFENPDGTVVIEVKNGEEQSAAVNIEINGEAICPLLEPHSINTFLCKEEKK